MLLQLTERPIVETRGNMSLIIFPSRPYWFSATSEIRIVLDVLSVEISVQEASARLQHELDVSSEEASETLVEIGDLLFRNGVLRQDGRVCEKAREIDPHFQVNAVENVLVIAATQGCNLRCLHCYASANVPYDDEMTTDEVGQLIDDLASMQWKNEVSRVGLTGGEFFHRSDAMELIEKVHRHGFKVLVSTNGLLLDPVKIEQLGQYQNLKISVSLDGNTAELHEQIRGTNTFARTVETIRLLTMQGTYTGVNMFVHAGNVHAIEKTLEFAHSLGVRAFNCLNMMRVGRANSSLSQLTLTRIPEHVLYRCLFEILRVNPTYTAMMANSTFANQVMGIAGGVKSHTCGIGTNRALYVRADGSIYPCPDTALPRFLLGNVRATRLQVLWETSETLRELRDLNIDTLNSTCAACDVRYFCAGGCRGENYQVTHDLRAPHFNCEEIRRTILEIMWILTEDPTFLRGKVEELYDSVCF